MASKKAAGRSNSTKTTSKPANKKTAAKKSTSKSSSRANAKSSTKKSSGKSSGRSTYNRAGSKKGSYKAPADLYRNNAAVNESATIIVAAISVVAIISLFSSKMGVFGETISAVLKGLLGLGGYLLPFVVIIFSIWIFMSEKREGFKLKIAASVLFLCSIAAFAFALSSDGQGSISVQRLYDTGGALNGGVIGGVFGNFLISFFGKMGTYIILTVLIIISIVLVTELSFINGMSSAAKYVGDAPKKHNEHVKERNERRLAKREEKEYRIAQRAEKAEKRREVFNILMDENDFDDNDSWDYDDRIEYDEEEPEKFPEGELPSDYLIRNIARHNGTAAPEMNIKNDTENTRIDFNKERGIQSVISGDEYYDDDDIDEETEEYDGEFELNASNEENAQNEPVIEEDYKESIPVQNVNAEKAVSEPKFEIMFDDEPDDEEISPVQNNTENNVKKSDTELPSHIDSGIIGGAIYTEEEKKAVTGVDSNMPAEPASKPERKLIPYKFPPLSLLGKDPNTGGKESKAEMLNTASKLESTLKSFGVEAKVMQINQGPTVTRYELSPSQGVKVSKIVNLADDIALNLAASGIRIEAPIPGKAAVGIEVPNKNPRSVYLRTVLESEEFQNFPSKLAFALGQDIAGNPVVTDIDKMPHLLIAGATGSGKSVCINTLITSIIYKAKPDEVKLLLVDPKVVELSVYNGIPHLLIPVVTDPKKAAGALNWAVREMLQRYNDFAENSVRDIKGYNRLKAEKGETDFMPQIVIIIDELADLMMAAPGEVEDSICRLAQMARAAGIHLIIATQRPSVDVITGLIKANIPSRLAFAVSSGIDSRTILDSVGAERLLGKGDMLFNPVGMSKPVRIQGAFVTDQEVESIVEFLKQNKSAEYNTAVLDEITSSVKHGEGSEEHDEYYDRAIELVVNKEKASVSMLQRQFRIGYNRAARLMDELEATGIVGPEDGSKPRKVLISKAEYNAAKNSEQNE